MIPETARRPDWPRLVKGAFDKLNTGAGSLLVRVAALEAATTVMVGVRSITASGSVLAADYLILADATAAAVTITLPPAASNAGRVLVVKKTDASANAVTLDGNAAETIDGAATLATTTQFVAFTVACDGTGWWIV